MKCLVKQASLVFLLAILSCKSFAQRQTRYHYNNGDECPKLYLGLNVGLENPNGILGFSMDAPIIPHLSGRAGIGISSWGYKYYAEAVGYLGKCHRKWAAGLGVSHNTGLSNFKTTMPTSIGDQDITLDLLAQTNAFINFYHYWTLGKRKNRFYLQLGYSIPLSTGKYYELKSNVTLTQDGQDAMKILRPGGLSIGVGFYFDAMPKK